MPVIDDQIHTLAKWIAESKKIVGFTGAGISTESGLSDFTGKDGVWTRRTKGLPIKDPKVTLEDAKPNRTHYALVELQELGKLKFLISQNVDNLHLISGIHPDKLAEIHGNDTLLICTNCQKKVTKNEVNWNIGLHGFGFSFEDESELPERRPRCPKCGGNLLSTVINYRDPLPEKEYNDSVKHSKDCDLFIVLGSSLITTPANKMPIFALNAGAKLVIVNGSKTKLDDKAHLKITADVGDVMERALKEAKQLIHKS
ncbi:MAG: NAD-dependent deacetylase [Promethearchaeota archaeon]